MTVTNVSETGQSVVITGYAATTALADDMDATWQALLAGASAIRRLEDAFVTEFDLPVRIGAKLAGAPETELTRVEQRRLSYVEQLALVLGRRAWRHSGSPDVSLERLAVSIRTGLGGGDALVNAVDALRAGGYRRVPPMTVPMVMPNGPAATVGLELGAKGGVYAPVSACSSGAEAIAHAWRLIATGEADTVVAGGVEGQINAVPIASFAMMRAMSRRNDDPQAASRPFDSGRDGFVLGEGGAVLILESEQHARARGAVIHGRVLGAGITSDGYHITGTDPDGAGAARAMTRAIAAANLSPSDVGHVNAHATSTQVGDISEARAIEAVVPHASVMSRRVTACRYALLAAGLMAANYVVLGVASGLLPLVVAKLVTEAGLFLVSYRLQRCVVFRSLRSGPPADRAPAPSLSAV